jgi:hypothetical protein
MLRRLMLAAAAGIVLSASNAGADERVHRIGVLVGGLPADTRKEWEQGLHERGWIVGGNLLIEYRYYQGLSEQIPVLATSLERLSRRSRSTPLPRPLRWSLPASVTPLHPTWSKASLIPGAV